LAAVALVTSTRREGGLRRVLFRWRGVAVSTYTACLYTGVVAGLLVAREVAARSAMDAGRVVLAALILMAPALLGARLLFVARHWADYRHDLSRLWRQTDAGAALYGGLFVALVVSVPLLRALDLPLGAFWDVGVLVILIAKAVTKIGCLLNGCCAGRVTRGWLALSLPDDQGVRARRVPSPVLESALATLILMVLAALWPRLAGHGAAFLLALALYALGRYVLESARAQVDRIGDVSVNRAISGALAAISTLLLVLGGLLPPGAR